MLQVSQEKGNKVTHRKPRLLKSRAGVSKSLTAKKLDGAKKAGKRKKPGVLKVYHYRIYCLNLETTATSPREALRKLRKMVARTKVTKSGFGSQFTWTGYVHPGRKAPLPYPPTPAGYAAAHLRLWYTRNRDSRSTPNIGPPETIVIALPANVEQPQNLNLYPRHRQVDNYRYIGGWELSDFPRGTLIRKGDCWKKLRAADLFLPWADQG